MGKIRKRYMVSEGDLFQLYADIKEARRREGRAEFMNRFRRLLSDAQRVHLTIEKDKKGGLDGSF